MIKRVVSSFSISKLFLPFSIFAIPLAVLVGYSSMGSANSDKSPSGSIDNAPQSPEKTEKPEHSSPSEPTDLTDPEKLNPSDWFLPYTENNFARIIVNFPSYSFYLGPPDINGVAYVPNFSPRLGAEYQYKEFGLGFSIALPLPKEEIDRRGRSEQMDFQINKQWRGRGYDAFFQSYKGFYIASPWNELKISKPSKYPQLPDAAILHYGFNYYQLLDDSNYSLKAAYSQMEKQIRSGGSFLWTLFYDHLEMNRGDQFTPGSDESLNNRFPELRSAYLNTWGFTFGYGYTFLYKSFQVSAQITAGPGIQFQKYQDGISSSEDNTHLALKGTLNGGIGYSIKDHYFGGKFILDTVLSHVEGTDVYSSLISGSLYYGLRY